jgi:tripartite-type tricarboxylate transporter receptor subunit TctC
MELRRHKFLHLTAGGVALAAISRDATAQTYPARPITVIVPFAPGGSTDVIARIVAEHMSRTLNQQLIIENVAGAGGTTGSIRAMRASPDGYTIVMGHMGTHGASVAYYPNLAYKPDVDFAPIGMVIEQSIMIIARKDFPPKDLKEFVGYVKANADKLNMAHAGVGSNTFNFCVMLNAMLGVKPTLVPFNGSGPAANAMIGGQVDYMCNGIPEVGHTDALDKAIGDPNVRRRLAEIGCDVPETARRGQVQLLMLVKNEMARWMPIIREVNVNLQ